MGIQERRQRERHELRESILEAAREMFVTEGYQAVTMRSLAKRIEYSPTAIYLHFKDKEALLEELCNADLAALTTAVQAATNGVEGVERLYLAARAYVTFALEHKAQYQLLFMMPKPNAPDASPPEKAAYDNLREGFAQFIGRGLLRADLTDPDVLAQVYFCGLHGIVASKIAMGSCELPRWRDPLTQATFFVDSLVKGIHK